MLCTQILVCGSAEPCPDVPPQQLLLLRVSGRAKMAAQPITGRVQVSERPIPAFCQTSTVGPIRRGTSLQATSSKRGGQPNLARKVPHQKSDPRIHVGVFNTRLKKGVGQICPEKFIAERVILGGGRFAGMTCPTLRLVQPLILITIRPRCASTFSQEESH